MNKGKVIGFDLDGTLAEIDIVALRMIDKFHALTDTAEYIFMSDLYYRNVKPSMNARELMHEDDRGIIITSRPEINTIPAITKRWVQKYYPDFELIMTGQNPIEGNNNNYDWKKWNEDIIERKAKAIKEHDVYVYFDDSATAVEGLRKRGIHALQVGGRI